MFAAGVWHMKSPGHLASALHRQTRTTLWASPVGRVVVISWGTLEVALSLTALGSLLWGSPTLQQQIAWCVAAFYVALGAWLLSRRQMNPGMPCGCIPNDRQGTGLTVLRPLVAASGASGFAWFSGSSHQSIGTEDLVILLLAAVGLSMVAWWGPSARFSRSVRFNRP